MRHGIFFFNFDEKRETFFAVAAKILIRTLQNFYPRREILFSIKYIFVDLKKNLVFIIPLSRVVYSTLREKHADNIEVNLFRGAADNV